jgi:hypothetical protein
MRFLRQQLPEILAKRIDELSRRMIRMVDDSILRVERRQSASELGLGLGTKHACLGHYGAKRHQLTPTMLL